jgi:ParB family transcriptional regulator, chromosome partitioning protein
LAWKPKADLQLAKTQVTEIPIKDITYPKNILRSELPRKEFEELVSSIRSNGLLEPILVRQLANHRYELIAGFRRLRSFEYLEIAFIPCVVIEANDEKAFELSLIENVQRQTLNPIDEAIAFKKYVEDYGYGGYSVLASKIGKSQEYVSLRMTLLQLPREVRDKIVSRQISPTVAQELFPLSPSQQRRIAALVVEKSLTKRQVRNMVKSASREEFEGIAWLTKCDSTPSEITRTETSAIQQSVSLFKATLAQLSQILETLPESSILREILFEYRLSLSREMDSLIKFEKRLKS